MDKNRVLAFFDTYSAVPTDDDSDSEEEEGGGGGDGEEGQGEKVISGEAMMKFAVRLN